MILYVGKRTGAFVCRFSNRRIERSDRITLHRRFVMAAKKKAKKATKKKAAPKRKATKKKAAKKK